MNQHVFDSNEKILPCYLTICNDEVIPTTTLEQAIDLADTHYNCTIYKRNGTTGPLFYKYLCNVEKHNNSILKGSYNG